MVSTTQTSVTSLLLDKVIAQDFSIKLRATAANLTPNDCFTFLTDLLESGARSQAHQLEERMQKELDASNAATLAEYEEAVAMYRMWLAEWTALLPAKGRGPAAVPSKCAAGKGDPIKGPVKGSMLGRPYVACVFRQSH